MGNPREINRRGPIAEKTFQPLNGYTRLSDILETVTEWAGKEIGDQKYPGQNLRVRFYRLGTESEDTLASTILDENVLGKISSTRIRYFNRNCRITKNAGIAHADFSLHSRGFIKARLSTNNRWNSPEPPDADMLPDAFFFMYRLLGSKGNYIALEVQREKGIWDRIGRPADLYDLLETREKESMPQPEELEEAIRGIQNFGRTVFDQAQSVEKTPRGVSSCVVRFRDEEFSSGSLAEINVLVPLREPNTISYPLTYADSALYHDMNIRRISYDVTDGSIVNMKWGRTEGLGNTTTQFDPIIIKKMWKMMRKEDLSVKVLARGNKWEDWVDLDLSENEDEWNGRLSPLGIGLKYKDALSQGVSPKTDSVTLFRSNDL